jgi:hypothetical protein
MGLPIAMALLDIGAGLSLIGLLGRPRCLDSDAAVCIFVL